MERSGENLGRSSTVRTYVIMHRYIAFEGIDGSGKSTQIALLCDWLVRRYYTPIRLLEPSYGRYGRAVRKSMDAGDDLPVEKQIELFTLDRKDHVRQKIQPLLRFVRDNNYFVLVQDRCYLSAPAYQAVGTTAIVALLRMQQEFAPKPDVSFLIDTPVAEALRRKRRAVERCNLFETAKILQRARENYLFLAGEGTENITVVDGSKGRTEVHRAVLRNLEEFVHDDHDVEARRDA